MSSVAGRTSFPRQQALTRRFTLGIPRSFSATADGRRIRFVRSGGPRDPVQRLYEMAADEASLTAARVLVDPGALTDHGAESAAERTRRERLREVAGGVTSYASDRSGDVLAFTLAGRLWTVDIEGVVRDHPATVGAFDPRVAPDGRHIAYVIDGAVHVIELVGGARAHQAPRVLVGEQGVSWGVAEFVAAEEMGRQRGFWWDPAGERLAVARVDERHVESWHLGDPSTPWRAPVVHRYPAAGTANADVGLHVVSLHGGRVEVDWDRARWPYLTRVRWDDAGLLCQVQSRDQRSIAILAVAADSGTTTPLRVINSAHPVELVAGSPVVVGGHLVTVEDWDVPAPTGSRALMIDGQAATSPRMQVRSVVGAVDGRVVFTASGADPRAVEVHAIDVADGVCRRRSPDGLAVHGATVCAPWLVLRRSAVDLPVPKVWVEPLGDGPIGRDETGRGRDDRVGIEVVAEAPSVEPRPRWLRLGERELSVALLMPERPAGPLPVVLDPYGGPHVQRVVAARTALAGAQWLADQGFGVLIIDGRGTPGRGPTWERAIHGALADVVLADQLAGLAAAGHVEPRLDLERVGIRGWSFGGYLAALAALRAPHAIHAAVVGAPVTDWRLYDTHYTERYLGHPDEQPAAYRRASLVDADGELVDAVVTPASGTPRILIVHGLADDNVVAAHSLRLSGALLRAGIDHRFLPLAGVTHMTPQATISENLARVELDFLADALGSRAGGHG